jgi:amino-acid N-acetyltransferase
MATPGCSARSRSPRTDEPLGSAGCWWRTGPALRARGLRAVYLLTTTAADYFRRFGFEDARRDEAPAVLQRSSEFASVCPASAACLAMSR